MKFLHNKFILIISPEAWGDHFVSKHHYAQTLGSLDNQVFFLNPPSRHFKVHEVENGVKVVSYRPHFRGLGRLPKSLSAWLTKIEFSFLQKRLGVAFDVIWNFDSSRFFNMALVGRGVVKICHLVDLNQDIQRPLLASTSDLCLGTTEYICAILRRHNRNIYKIGHGYQPQLDTSDFHFHMPGSNKLKALYVGNLSMRYIDWDILEVCARKFPRIDFVFVGPEGRSNLSPGEDSTIDSRRKIKEYNNVYFFGSVKARHIPKVLQTADALLIAYKEEHHKDQAAPHKMVEYLASGKPIAATFTEEFQDASPLLFMSSENSDFPQQIERVLDCGQLVRSGPDLDTYEDLIARIDGIIHERGQRPRPQSEI